MDDQPRPTSEANPETARNLILLGFSPASGGAEGTSVYRRDLDGTARIEVRTTRAHEPHAQGQVAVEMTLRRADGIVFVIRPSTGDGHLTEDVATAKLPELVMRMCAAQELLRAGRVNHKGLLRRVERQLLDAALRLGNQMITRAARLLDMRHQSLSRIIKSRHQDLTPPGFRKRRRSLIGGVGRNRPSPKPKGRSQPGS